MGSLLRVKSEDERKRLARALAHASLKRSGEHFTAWDVAQRAWIVAQYICVDRRDDGIAASDARERYLGPERRGVTS
ncbi:MAG TPA: hypothetical protein VLI21_13830 [Casimicrobiaceae bacterium]|nr:hypothetical protein [Casimicrobiaceae bacterium]